ncbi:MAG: A24 family peptidase [Pseudomonadota bacterium]
MKAGPENLKNLNSESLDSFRRPIEQTLIGTALLGLTFTAVAIAFSASPVFIGSTLWVSLGLAMSLLAIAAVDLDRYIIPDLITLPLIVLGVAYFWAFELSLIESVSGASVGYILIAGLAWFWRARFDRDGVGLGDAKLLTAIGAWCGIFALPFALLVASSSAIGAYAVAKLFGKTEERDALIPFGPFLSIGFWVVWVGGYIIR